MARKPPDGLPARSHAISPPAHARSSANTALEVWRRGEAPVQGFYIPYRYAQGCRPRPAPTWLTRALTAAHPRMQDWLFAARGYGARLQAFAKETSPGAPRFDQDWFTGLDATMAYTLVRSARPARIVEIGSGHSTRFMSQAIADGALSTHLTSIDPEPRKSIDALCDAVVRDTLANADLACVDALESGDILFVDGSHIAMPGSDVEQVCIELIPRLPVGVLLHVHDLLLPDPYPDSWQWRGYNEQGMITALIGAGRLRIESANAYIQRHQPAWLNDIFSAAPEGALVTSMWFQVA